MKSYKIIEDDVLNQLEVLAWDSPFHAILSDPPYGLSFMNKKWDSMTAPQFQAWVTEWATLMLNVVYPGAVLMMFGGTRTYHRLACGLEEAGWEVYDSLAWMYGSGFPKSHDISKAIDREAGAERKVVGERVTGNAKQRTNGSGEFGGWANSNTSGQQMIPITAPATPDAERWQGYGTALKPAYEPIILARAPRGTRTYAALAREFGTGALNVDGGRIEAADKAKFPAGIVSTTESTFGNGRGLYDDRPRPEDAHPAGRWPANILLDEEAAAILDEQSGESGTGKFKPRSNNRTVTQFSPENGWNSHSMNPNNSNAPDDYGDKGGASRFFKTVNFSPACVLCNLPIGVESSRIIPYPTEGEQWQIASSVDESTSPASLHSGSVHAPAPQSGPHKNEGNSPSSGGPANNAGASSRNTSPTGTPIAPNNAPLMQGVRSALSARFAESLCDSCVTAIAQSIVVTQQGQSPASRLCQACMPEHSAQILSHNLVRFAESLDNTDTTTITANLNRLLGFVQLAIESIIAERSSASAPTRFRYHSKASTWERSAGLDGKNTHPTVKPIKLTTYLATLLLPPELDEPRKLLVPFSGSGSEMIGGHLAGWDEIVGIEIDNEYIDIAEARLAWWSQFKSYEEAQAARKK